MSELVFLKLIYRINTMPIKIPAGSFVEVDESILEYIGKCKEPIITQTTLNENKIV
jgi:hypothetical protein